MEKEQGNVCLADEAKKFIQILKSLDEKQQIGVNLTIEGLKLLAGKEKKRF